MMVDDKLRLKVDAEPTYWNKDTALGMAILGPLGAFVGAFLGKARMEREEKDGKVVKEPSVFNKETLIGGGIGAWITSPAPLIALAALDGGLGLAVGFGTYLTGIAVGALIGGAMGKARMEQEYVQAEQQQRERQQDQQRGQGQAQEYANHPANDKTIQFTEELTAQRAQQTGPQVG